GGEGCLLRPGRGQGLPPPHLLRPARGPGAPVTGTAEYALWLGDDALIRSQRLAHWLTRAPELEEEVALANIALDLLGQARALLTYAGSFDGRDEDALAYRRAPE